MAMKIDHIGIAVNSISETLRAYCEVLELDPKQVEMEIVHDQNAKVAMLPIGESRIELLESTTPEGVIAKAIERKGEGLHHIAIRVHDIDSALDNLIKKGLSVVDKKPRIGAGGAKIAFLHPKATKALLELVERD
jgi:methylmalonyl-CoA/ethylmalonyl-CoA epimerase